MPNIEGKKFLSAEEKAQKQYDDFIEAMRTNEAEKLVNDASCEQLFQDFFENKLVEVPDLWLERCLMLGAEIQETKLFFN